MKDKRKFIKDEDIPTVQGKDTFSALQKQVHAEYDLGWKHQLPKKKEWEVRLKLFNNQKRAKDKVGDTTMFTTFQTVLASLYVDRLNVSFGAREEGDNETAENLNLLAENDYDEMDKDIVDYNWIWDTLFFGRGLVEMSRWLRKPEENLYIPLPKNIDPLVFVRDPRAHSVNGDKEGSGAARFFGWEQKMTKQEIEDHPHMFSNIDFKDIKFGSGTQSLLRDAIEARDTAQGTQTQKIDGEEGLGPNAEYDITKWYTHYNDGEKIQKVIAYLANDRSKLIGLEILKTEYWPVIDRPLYPHSHDWDGTSIPDLTEDKQRARAVAQNLGLKAMKADLYPMYIYDTNKVVNKKDLSFNFNKFIPVDAKGQSLADAILPMIKNRPNMQLLDFIFNTLDVSAQKATATPDIQQGIQSEKDRPLGETNLIASNVDTRYSLATKIFGWSERRFWGIHWYGMYKEYFEDKIDEKILRLAGAFGTKWRPLTRENIISRIDPDVTVESALVSRAKQFQERQLLSGFFSLALQEPTANRRYGLKKLAKLNGMPKDEIERLFPPTIDEREAEQENDQLNKNELVPITREQDHNVHLEIHAMANDTEATKAHIKAHEMALMIRRNKPELFPQQPESTSFEPPGSAKITPPNQAPIEQAADAIPRLAN